MKSLLSLIALLLIATYLCNAEVAVTIYNQRFSVVKDTRYMDFPNGMGDIQFRDVASQIEPTSVHFSAEGVELLEQNYQYDLVNSTKILEKYIEQSIQVVTDSKQGTAVLTGTLLAFTSGRDGDIVMQSEMGEIMIIRRSTIRDLTFPELPEGLITKPTLVWKVDSESAGSRPATVSYMTRGMYWHAEYVAVLADEGTSFSLSAWVSIDNKSGATYKDAKVKLMAGDVHRAYQIYGEAVTMAWEVPAQTARDRESFEEKAFADYHMYTLQRTSTLRDQEVKQISLFEPTTVDANIIYTYNASMDRNRVKKELVFENSEIDGLGVPLPAGKFRIYQRDTDESLEFIGEDRIHHTPIDEEIDITIGYAFDLVGERERTEDKKISKRARRQAYTIKLRNHKKETTTIRVDEHLPGDWEILNQSHDLEKINSRTIRFTVEVPSGEEVIITYRFQYTT